MTPVKSKACPRCHGDIFLDKDVDGWYYKCLQCGFESELESLEEFRSRTENVEPVILAITKKLKK